MHPEQFCIFLFLGFRVFINIYIYIYLFRISRVCVCTQPVDPAIAISIMCGYQQEKRGVAKGAHSSTSRAYPYSSFKPVTLLKERLPE